MNEPQKLDEDALIARATARLRAGILAVVFAAVGGMTLWVATAWLVVRGGPHVGRHLGLLGIYFPGYTVSWGGAFLGLLYGALVGALSGGLLAWIYNWLADRRGHS